MKWYYSHLSFPTGLYHVPSHFNHVLLNDWNCAAALMLPHLFQPTQLISLDVTACWRPVNVCLRPDGVLHVWCVHSHAKQWEREVHTDNTPRWGIDASPACVIYEPSDSFRLQWPPERNSRTLVTEQQGDALLLLPVILSLLHDSLSHDGSRASGAPWGPHKRNNPCFLFGGAVCLFASGDKSIPRRSKHILSKWQRQYYYLRYQHE